MPTSLLHGLNTPAERRRFVQLFTQQLVSDSLLGPFFPAHTSAAAARVSARELAWWEQALAGACYLGRPSHALGHPFREAHLQRWCQLLADTFRNHFTGPEAAEAQGHLLNEAALLSYWLLVTSPTGSQVRTRRPAASSRLAAWQWHLAR